MGCAILGAIVGFVLVGGAMSQSTSLFAAIPSKCSAPSTGPASLSLPLNSSTVHWGYFYESLKPRLVVNSGDTIVVEMATHHAGDDYDKMIKGDPGMESIFKWTADGQGVPMRGRAGKGDGVHILTGPIYVCGAEPGDVLQVDIVDLQPRANPVTGKTYGSNAAAYWGFHFRAGFLDNDVREIVTIYELIKDAAGKTIWAVPDYQFRYGQTTFKPTTPGNGYAGPTTPCVTYTGATPDTVEAAVVSWNNSASSTYSGVKVPCVDGKQAWGGLYYPGIVTEHPTGSEDYSIRGKFKVPVNFHIGNIGIAPAYKDTVDSVPPMPTGGNVDDRRTGVGASLYYPIEVPGALLSMGDAHTAMGDSELDGTGIETSITATVKVTLHKNGSLPLPVQGLTFPLLENANEYVIHGYTYADYLETLKDPSQVYSDSSLDKAMITAYNQTRDFLMQSFDLTENQAITAMTVFVDFGITQVVDGNWGIHAVIPKWPFANSTEPYMPKTISGTSTPASITPVTA